MAEGDGTAGQDEECAGTSAWVWGGHGGAVALCAWPMGRGTRVEPIGSSISSPHVYVYE